MIKLRFYQPQICTRQRKISGSYFIEASHSRQISMGQAHNRRIITTPVATAMPPTREVMENQPQTLKNQKQLKEKTERSNTF